MHVILSAVEESGGSGYLLHKILKPTPTNRIFRLCSRCPFCSFLYETWAGVILSIVKKTGDSVTASVSKNLAGLGISCNSNRPTPTEPRGQCHSERAEESVGDGFSLFKQSPLLHPRTHQLLHISPAYTRSFSLSYILSLSNRIFRLCSR